MTSINATKPGGQRLPKLAFGLAIVAAVALGAFSAPANARWNGRDEHRAYHHDWDGGYYRSPPIVYGGPYAGYSYYPPPVVYGPGFGLNINIR